MPSDPARRTPGGLSFLRLAGDLDKMDSGCLLGLDENLRGRNRVNIRIPDARSCADASRSCGRADNARRSGCSRMGVLTAVPLSVDKCQRAVRATLVAGAKKPPG